MAREDTTTPDPGMTQSAKSGGSLSESGVPLRGRPGGGARTKVFMRIEVVENQIEAALKALKKRMQKEGLFQEMKRRAHYEKPSVKRKRKQAQARRKRRKAMRRQQQPDDD